jgi:hypothetical protein
MQQPTTPTTILGNTSVMREKLSKSNASKKETKIKHRHCHIQQMWGKSFIFT